MTDAEKYVKMIAGHGDRFHARLVELGEVYTGRIPAKDAGLESWVKMERPRNGLCYMNAQKYVLMHPDTDLTYCEGYWAWSGGLWPVHHAWLVDAEGRVVDMTAESCDTFAPEKVDPAKDTYWGMTVPGWFIREQCWKKKEWGVVSDAYMSHIAEAEAA